MSEGTAGSVEAAAAAVSNIQQSWCDPLCSGLSALWRQYLDIVFSGRIEPEASKLSGLSFASACCLFAVALVVLDYCIFFTRKRSIFQVEYKLAHGWGLFIALPVAASIVGFIGFSLDILQTSRAAAIAVGLAWPVFLVAFFNAPEAMARGGEDTESGGETLE